MNIVIAQHAGGPKHYIFSVPNDRTLRKDDIIQVQTNRGVTIATCVCDSFDAPTELVNTLLSTYGGKIPLAPVLGHYTYDQWLARIPKGL